MKYKLLIILIAIIISLMLIFLPNYFTVTEWQVMRNMANIVFTAIMIIFGIIMIIGDDPSKKNMKRIFLWSVISALIINFSLVISDILRNFIKLFIPSF